MPLKITRASDPIEVKTLTLCVSSNPGLGKTTLGFMADKAINLDFDHTVHRCKNRGDTSIMESWSDAANMTAADLAPFNTVVVDTVGRALDMLTLDIIATDPKAGRGGALTLQGYGALKTRFTAWLKMVRSFGKDVVLLCHSNEERKGDELIERLDIQGGSKNEVYKVSDVMGRIYMDKGKRVLNFNPSDVTFGKNPGRLPVEEVPEFTDAPDFLATVIARTKAALNEQTAAQKEAGDVMTTWKKKIEAASTAGDFDDLAKESKDAPESVRLNIKRMIVKAAKADGYEFNKSTGYFDIADTKGKKSGKEEHGAAS